MQVELCVCNVNYMAYKYQEIKYIYLIEHMLIYMLQLEGECYNYVYLLRDFLLFSFLSFPA